jgi:hypothetical protein
MCAATAPRHFRLDDGKSRALREDIEPGDIVLDTAAPARQRPSSPTTLSATASRPTRLDTGNPGEVTGAADHAALFVVDSVAGTARAKYASRPRSGAA